VAWRVPIEGRVEKISINFLIDSGSILMKIQNSKIKMQNLSILLPSMPRLLPSLSLWRTGRRAGRKKILIFYIVILHFDVYILNLL